MRKQIVLAILLVSVTLISFITKEKSGETFPRKKDTSILCGPAFDSLYNQHSTAFVGDLFVTDPLDNTFSLNFQAEPSENYSISGAGSQCGYAGGIYHFWVTIDNPASSGSIKIVDQSNNVIVCKNIGTSHSYHLLINAQCATTYKIIISNSSC
jgi:hypothetical protein